MSIDDQTRLMFLGVAALIVALWFGFFNLGLGCPVRELWPAVGLWLVPPMVVWVLWYALLEVIIWKDKRDSVALRTK